MASVFKRLRAARKQFRVFRDRAFMPEAAILERLLAKLARLGKVRLTWLGLLIASICFHLSLLPFLSVRHGETPADREVAGERTFLVHFALPPELRRPDPAPAPPQAPPESAPEQEKAVAPPSPPPGPRSPAPQDSPAAPRVVGAGSGPDGPGGAGGGGGGSGGSGRGAALARFGGSDETEEAVRRGLEWLARHQRPDGHWDCDEFSQLCPAEGACDGRGNPQYDVGVTALALAAFAAQGDEASHRWRSPTQRAVSYLLDIQASGGAFGREEGSFMYNQALAVYALAQVYRRDQLPEVSVAVERGLGFIARAQQQGGGWDYTSESTGRDDLSITGWIILAIDAARGAGFSFPAHRAASAREFVSRMVDPESSTATYADARVGAGERRPGLLPVAMVALLLSGDPLESRPITLLADAVVRLKPEARGRAQWNETGQSLYGWYYATLALFHRGGKWWDAWTPAMKDALLALQRTSGHATGSWDPDPNWIGQVGGRVYATALAVLTLEVYYRTTPKFLETSG
jgi:hypothetical protein